MSVRGLFCEQDRDAEAGGIHRIVLQEVVCLGGKGRIQAGFQGLPGPGIGPERGPEHSSVPVPDEIDILRGAGDGVVGDLFVHRPAEGADELSDFLFHGHPGQEVIGAFFGAEGGILVGGDVVAAGEQEKQGRGEERGSDKWS